VSYLSDDLLTAIKRDSFLPNSQGMFTDAQLLQIADEQILDTLAPLLVSMDSGWYRESIDITLIASQSAYDFPRYAMWDKFFKIALVDSTTSEYFDIQRTDPGTLQNISLTSTTTPRFCYLQDKQIVLVPAPSDGAAATYVMRVWIYRRPGRLVATTAAAQVQSIATPIVTYTGAPPATFTSSSVHDFYLGTSPFRRIDTAVTASAQSGSTQTFSAADVALLAASNYVCLRDETVWPAIPLELSSHLKDLVIAQMARTQMDTEQYETVKSRIAERARTALGSAPGAQIVSQPKKFSMWNNGLVAGRLWAGRKTTP